MKARTSSRLSPQPSAGGRGRLGRLDNLLGPAIKDCFAGLTCEDAYHRAPGRTRTCNLLFRTCNLLFRRCLSLDAVLDHEPAGRRTPRSESYQLVGSSRVVTLSSENARSRYQACPHPCRQCTAAVGRSLSLGELQPHGPSGEWSSCAAWCASSDDSSAHGQVDGVAVHPGLLRIVVGVLSRDTRHPSLTSPGGHP
jgi:hypothetical protein